MFDWDSCLGYMFALMYTCRGHSLCAYVSYTAQI